jgi:hypothetical protein
MNITSIRGMTVRRITSSRWSPEGVDLLHVSITQLGIISRELDHLRVLRGRLRLQLWLIMTRERLLVSRLRIMYVESHCLSR